MAKFSPNLAFRLSLSQSQFFTDNDGFLGYPLSNRPSERDNYQSGRFNEFETDDLPFEKRVNHEYYDDYAANDLRELGQYPPSPKVELSRNRNKKFEEKNQQLQQYPQKNVSPGRERLSQQRKGQVQPQTHPQQQKQQYTQDGVMAQASSGRGRGSMASYLSRELLFSWLFWMFLALFVVKSSQFFSP